MKKTLTTIASLSLAAVLLFAGCTKPTATPSATGTQGAEATPTLEPTPGIKNAYPFKVEDVQSLEYTYEAQQVSGPFWLGNVMYNECISFIDDGKAVVGKTLFKPLRIVSVRDWTLKNEYKEGTDWVWDGESKQLTLPEGSTIPFFAKGDLAGEGVEAYPKWDAQGRSRFGNALYCVSEFLYSRQIAITYAYDETEYKGPEYAYQGDALPKTMAKLKAGEDIKIVGFGDSIMAGGDASSGQNREPFLPLYVNLFKNALQEEYGSKVTMRNISVGGMTSEWGAENASNVVRQKPDLVILGFGQNDSGLGSAAVTAANTKTIIDAVKAEFPDCEFILMSTLKPNADAGFLSAAVHPKIYKELTPLFGEGIVGTDVYAMSEYLLASKNYADITGNNINHPNDFFIRIHAMMLQATLIDYKNK